MAEPPRHGGGGQADGYGVRRSCAEPAGPVRVIPDQACRDLAGRLRDLRRGGAGQRRSGQQGEQAAQQRCGYRPVGRLDVEVAVVVPRVPQAAVPTARAISSTCLGLGLPGMSTSVSSCGDEQARNLGRSSRRIAMASSLRPMTPDASVPRG